MNVNPGIFNSAQQKAVPLAGLCRSQARIPNLVEQNETLFMLLFLDARTVR